MGLLCTQIAKANGCKVIGFDFDEEKVKIARNFGVEAFSFDDPDDALKISNKFTSNNGVDITLVAAASQNSVNDFGAKMCRKKGKLTQVGVTELSIPREIMFKRIAAASLLFLWARQV